MNIRVRQFLLDLAAGKPALGTAIRARDESLIAEISQTVSEENFASGDPDEEKLLRGAATYRLLVNAQPEE
jgi:hypothetical protein